MPLTWHIDYAYMASHRPGATYTGKETAGDEVSTGGLEGGVLIGKGPFEFKDATFDHNPNLPAVSIRYPNEEWSQPMLRAMFVEA